jgi:hypothetical protein
MSDGERIPAAAFSYRERQKLANTGLSVRDWY